MNSNNRKLSLTAILVLWWLLGASITVKAQSEKTNEIPALLDTLDYHIAKKQIYDKEKATRIATIEQRLKESNNSPSTQFACYKILFEEYYNFNVQKMQQAAGRLIELAKVLNDKDRLLEAQICMSYSYLWSGAFREASDFISVIDTAGASRQTRADYLLLRLNLEYESYLYVDQFGAFRAMYIKRIESLLEALNDICTDNDDKIQEAHQRLASLKKDYHTALRIVKQRQRGHKKEVSRPMSVKLGDTGFYNLEIGDTLEAMKFMVASAVIELKNGSKQSPALRKIAETIYNLGELERAYTYIRLTMDNAVSFGSTYRMYEASITLPAIDKDLYEVNQKQKNRLAIFTVVSLILVAILGILLLSLRTQHRKLRNSAEIIRQNNASLQTLNEQMTQINALLKETSSIKTTYLGQLLANNSEAISNMEDIIRVVKLKVKAKQYDDIVDYIYRREYVKKRKQMLNNFDEMFLKIFPNFVEKFNELLMADCQITTPDKKTLTPELRIFALVRLGISKSDTIAKILDFSSSTVRNYKTKIRKSAKGPAEAFDGQIMQIEAESS